MDLKRFFSPKPVNVAGLLWYPLNAVIICGDMASTVVGLGVALSDMGRLRRVSPVCRNLAIYLATSGVYPTVFGLLLTSSLIKLIVCRERCAAVKEPLLFRSLNHRRRARRQTIAVLLGSFLTSWALTLPQRGSVPNLCLSTGRQDEPDLQGRLCGQLCTNAAYLSAAWRRGGGGRLLRAEAGEFSAVMQHYAWAYYPSSTCLPQLSDKRVAVFLALWLLTNLALVQAAIRLVLTLRAMHAMQRLQNKATHLFRSRQQAAEKQKQSDVGALVILTEVGSQLATTLVAAFGKLVWLLGPYHIGLIADLVLYATAVAQLTCSFAAPFILSSAYRSELREIRSSLACPVAL